MSFTWAEKIFTVSVPTKSYSTVKMMAQSTVHIRPHQEQKGKYEKYTKIWGTRYIHIMGEFREKRFLKCTQQLGPSLPDCIQLIRTEFVSEFTVAKVKQGRRFSLKENGHEHILYFWFGLKMENKIRKFLYLKKWTSRTIRWSRSWLHTKTSDWKSKWKIWSIEEWRNVLPR